MKLSFALYRFIVQREHRDLSRSASGYISSMHVHALRFLAISLLGAFIGGCSIAMPVGDMFNANDKLITQSVVDNSQQQLSPELTPEDWGYASIALGTALDPVGTGETSPWANPKSGIRGDFIALGKPFLRNDLICRKFKATLYYQGETDKLTGSACRLSDGQWGTFDISTV